jgi:hypothetical protein
LALLTLTLAGVWSATAWLSSTSPLSSVALAQDVVRREYAIKAGVMVTLGKFVIWPEGQAPSKERPLTIGVLGRDPFFENNVNQLDQVVAAEVRKGMPVVVKRFTSIKDYQPCHILFVSGLAVESSPEKTVAQRLAAARQATQGTSVLIVGESTGVVREGGAANLLFDRTTNLIRLEVNPDAAARAGLKLAPDLLRLKLVQIVRDAPN